MALRLSCWSQTPRFNFNVTSHQTARSGLLMRLYSIGRDIRRLKINLPHNLRFFNQTPLPKLGMAKTTKPAKPAARPRRRAAAQASTPATSTSTSTVTATATATTTSSSGQSQELHFFKDSSALESWLETRHASTPSGIWVKIGKKNSGIASVSYDEVIDAGLCFGWIDGQRKSHDEQFFLQRFTPRRKNSMWSKRNVDKVEVLTKAGRMRPAGQVEVDTAREDGRWARAYGSSSNIEIPADFQEALEGSAKARSFFQTLNKTQRYPFLWRIETARRLETRQRRIRQFVDLLAERKTL